MLEVVGEGVRFPWTTCPGAAEPLRALAGMPLSIRCTAVGDHAPARRNCTHLFDLAGLAVAHAASGRAERRYDCAVWDTAEGDTRALLERDGEPLLRWRIEGGAIRTPSAFAGVELHGRFLAWAESALAPELAEAAIVLRRACFVAPSRSIDLDSYERADDMNDEMKLMLGRCHTFSEPNVAQALRVKGTLLRFTDAADALLANEPPVRRRGPRGG